MILSLVVRSVAWRSSSVAAEGAALALALVLLLVPACRADEQSWGHGGQRRETAYFASGCFWKTQHVFSKVPGVIETTAGFEGGQGANPSYKLVCTGKTGYAETVKVVFDPGRVRYSRLLDVFFRNHDPTTTDRQGPDVGTQYRSVIFYTSDAQRKEAEACKARLEKAHRFSHPIVTKIQQAGPFYAAEDYHQNYYEKHGEACY